MADIRVKYMGNEDGMAVVLYGGKLYTCDPGELGDNLTVGQWYTVDYRALWARGN